MKSKKGIAWRTIYILILALALLIALMIVYGRLTGSNLFAWVDWIKNLRFS